MPTVNKKLLYIIKLGGSVVTYKHRHGTLVRRSLLSKFAGIIKNISKSGNFQLIIVHGSGAAGHRLAKKYNLKLGTANDKKKWFGSFLSNIANQKLNLEITEIFIKKGLRAVSIHTASTIVQKNGRVADCCLKNIQQALHNKCIPILYGEMVFDEDLGMSICSGDLIVPYLAKKLGAQKIFFASDINGIFDKDPYIHRNTELIEKIYFAEIGKNTNLSGSHNIDATGGLGGKIEKMKSLVNSGIKCVEIFNGLRVENYKKIFLDKYFPHSKIIF